MATCWWHFIRLIGAPRLVCCWCSSRVDFVWALGNFCLCYLKFVAAANHLIPKITVQVTTLDTNCLVSFPLAAFSGLGLNCAFFFNYSLIWHQISEFLSIHMCPPKYAVWQTECAAQCTEWETGTNAELCPCLINKDALSTKQQANTVNSA